MLLLRMQGLQVSYEHRRHSAIAIHGDQMKFDEEFDDPLLRELDLPREAEPPAWQRLLEEANAYRYGLGDSLEDPRAALDLYERAAQLGSEEAFIALAEMHAAGDGCAESPRRGLEWLKRGAQLGSLECWAVLAEVFMGENEHFAVRHPENSRKCWRRFFENVDPADYGSEGGALFGRLRNYVSIVRHLRPVPDDLTVLRDFERNFCRMLDDTNPPKQRDAKVAQIRELLTGL